MNGSQIIVECLKRAGVDVVFAYPGGASMLLHQSLLDAPEINVVLPRHEQGGAFAAGGYARRSGRPGVCMATSGPGATNLVTGIADAFADSIPLVAFTAQVSSNLIGKNAFQETDVFGMTRSCVKHSYLALEAALLPQIIADAFYLASHGRPGPVVIDIPMNVLKEEVADVKYPDGVTPRLLTDYTVVDESAVAQLKTMLGQAKRPCVFAGGGVIASGASEELLKFAENYNLPVTTSLMGVGCFPENHLLSLKLLGMHGSFAANRAVHECDLLIGISVRFGDRVTGDIGKFAPQAKIVHVDIDNSEINKNKRADLSFVCDARAFLQRMNRDAFRLAIEDWHARIASFKAEHPFVMPSSKEGEIHCQSVIDRLNRLNLEDATIVTGVGQHQMWTAQFFQFRRPCQLLTSGGLGAMGFGLPAAIGASLAEKGTSPVILIDGDGSFQMNIQELATLYVENLPVKMIVMNNQNLGMVAQWEERFFAGRHANTDLRRPDAPAIPYPDFCQIAAGYGIAAERIWKDDEVDGALDRMLEYPGAFLLEVMTAHMDMVLPAIPAGKTCEDIILE